LLGLRYRFDLSDRWALLTRGDVSFGDSDGTFMLRANLAYTVGERRQNKILFGYQHKEADFEDSGLETAFEFSGFVAGFNACGIPSISCVAMVRPGVPWFGPSPIATSMRS
jgi:hypothetical protein